MKSILGYIKAYFREINKWVLTCSTILIAILIFFNYHFKLDDIISSRRSFSLGFFSRLLLFLVAFTLPYLFYTCFIKRDFFRHPRFVGYIFLAAALFALKVAFNMHFHFSSDRLTNNYWNIIVYGPLLLLIVGIVLHVCWYAYDRKEQPYYGLTTKNINWKPYWMMLLIMMPLVALASSQADFLATYPKIKHMVPRAADLSPWYKLLFELSYGSDFITIELFFRGFLVLAFIKWAGKDSILPMACFYCTIHFGKPLGECISSYFGGLLLGIVVYHTRSLFGGLMVHLGIAWLMELGGYMSNLLK